MNQDINDKRRTKLSDFIVGLFDKGISKEDIEN